MGKMFSGCEIVELAVQIEKNGKEFYTRLKALADNDEARGVFESLAKAEDRHIAVFRKIFDASCNYSPEGSFPDEYFSFMNSLASSYVFTRADKAEELIESIKTFREAVELGIELEKDSILFYEEMKRSIPESSHETVDRIIDEEKQHFKKLCDLKGGC